MENQLISTHNAVTIYDIAEALVLSPATLNYPGQEMGELAASTLIRRLVCVEGVNLNTIVPRHELIVRQS